MQKFSGSAPRPRAYAAGVGLQWSSVLSYICKTVFNHVRVLCVFDFFCIFLRFFRVNGMCEKAPWYYKHNSFEASCAFDGKLLRVWFWRQVVAM